MSEPGATPIFVDTGAFYARADEDDAHHDTATRVFENIRSGEVAYRPVFTSQSVLAELATLTLYKLGHSDAVRVVNYPTLLPRGIRASVLEGGATDRAALYRGLERLRLSVALMWTPGNQSPAIGR